MRMCPLALALCAAFPVLAQSQSTPSNAEPTLKPVVVTAPRSGPLQTNSSAARIALPPEQVPQSVISIDRTAIDELAAQNMPELLRAVSSVNAVDSRDTFNTQNRVRGFRAATVVDGVAMPSLFSNLDSTINIEQLDVLKGPAPAIAGGGQSAGAFGFVGGAIAVQTKSPTMTASREVGIRVGSRAERGVFADLNQPVSDTLGLRLVAESQSNGSETQDATTRRTGLYPSVRITPNADMELLMKARISTLRNLDDSGQPANGTVLPAAYSIPRSLRIGAAGQPDSKSDVSSLNAKWQHKLSDGWSYDVSVSRHNSKLNQYGAFTDDFFGPNPGPSYTLLGLWLNQKVTSTDLSANLRREWTAGIVKHRFLAAFDTNRTDDVGFMSNAVPLGTFDVTAPVQPNWVPLAAPAANTWQNNAYKSNALVLQDHMSFGKNLHVLASLKRTKIDVDNQWAAFGVNSQTKNSKTTPRVGVIYEASPGLSVFGGYGESFSVPTNGIYTTPPKPEGAKQTEVGIKLKNISGITANIALFDLRRSNVPTSDPANPFQSIQTGEQRSSGLDVDAQWQIQRDWKLSGHLTAMKPRISADNTLKVGNQIATVPKRMARIGVQNTIRQGALAGMSWGIAATHHSQRPVDAANTVFTPAATVFDAQIQYVAGQAKYGLSINNLLDKKYYVPSAYFDGTHVLPAQRRQLSFTASYSF